MQKPAKFISVLLLVCILAGASASCASSPPAGSEPPAVSRQPEESLPPSTGSAAPDPAVTQDVPPVTTEDVPPIATGDIPAIQPDEETRLSYTVDGAELTVYALRHYTLYGYSIVYDAEHYIHQAFGEGDSYWGSVGNYLSVSLVMGLPLEEAVAGIQLQEGFEMAPEHTTIGAGQYPALTLYAIDSAGLYRQFWALDCMGDVLLVEQSYDTAGDQAELYRASQLAMLDTLTLLS